MAARRTGRRRGPGSPFMACSWLCALTASCATAPHPSPSPPLPPDPRTLAGPAEPILLQTGAFREASTAAPDPRDAAGRAPDRPAAEATTPARAPGAGEGTAAATGSDGGAEEEAPADAPLLGGAATVEDAFRERLARLRPLLKTPAGRRSLRENLEYNQLLRELIALYVLSRAPASRSLLPAAAAPASAKAGGGGARGAARDPVLELFDALERLEAPSLDVRALEVALYQIVGLTAERDRALEALERAVHGIRDLRLRAVAFASEVAGLGSYTPVRGDGLRAGQTVLVYGELSGIRSRPLGDGRYRRAFRLDLAVLDGAGRERDRRRFAPSETSRKDLATIFFSVPYGIPGDLPSGAYRLSVRVEDDEGDGGDEAEVDFRVR